MNKKNILIVDDEEVILEYIEEILLDHENCDQFNITTCVNGCDAVEHIKNKKFDLIFTDFIMPVCNGLKIMQTARLDSPFNKSTPIICVSGYLPRFNTNVPFEVLDTVMFLEKPFSEHKIIRLFNIFLFSPEHGKIKDKF